MDNIVKFQAKDFPLRDKTGLAAQEIKNYLEAVMGDMSEFAEASLAKHFPSALVREGFDKEVTVLLWAAVLAGGVVELLEHEAVGRAGSKLALRKYAKLLRELR